MIYRYRISEADGSDAGEAHYAVLIQPGETIHASDGRKLRVIAVVATEDEASEYVGMLRVEAAQQLAPGTTGCESSQRVTSASC